MTLTERIVALHAALDRAGIAHAFGGALALAFCTAEPRGTQDVDLNVFLTPDEVDRLVAALPAGVAVDDADRRPLRRDGQARLWWDETPVDVFLSNHPFHHHVEADRRYVAFAGIERFPVLACQDLAVFKAVFARPKDVVDVATMAALGSIELASLERSVVALVGDAEGRAAFFQRVAQAVPEIG